MRSPWHMLVALLVLAGCRPAAQVDPPVVEKGPTKQGPQASPDAGGGDPDPEQPPEDEEPAPAYWAPAFGDDGWPVLQDALPVYELEVAEEDLAALDQHLWADDFLVPATFRAHGQTYAVELRYRGVSTRKPPKKSFQVRFPKEARFQGRRRIELLAQYRDGGVLTEKLWLDLGAAIGLQAPMARYVRLRLNGDEYGVMTELERVNADFVVSHAMDEDADVYRCGMYDCQLRPPPQEPYMGAWVKRTNEKQPWDNLWELLERIQLTPAHELPAFLEEHFALDAYLDWMALDVFSANAFQGDSRSFLVYEPLTRRWTYVPWDLNNARSTFAITDTPEQSPRSRHPLPGFTAYDADAYFLAEFRVGLGYSEFKPTWSTLSQRILEDPTLRRRFTARLERLLDTWFTEERIGPRVDAMQALLAGPLAEDPFVDPAYPPKSAQFLRRFVRERADYTRSKLQRLQRLGEHDLKVDAVGRDPSGRWFVRIANVSGADLSLEGRYLTPDLRVPRATQLGPVVVPTHGSVTFWEAASGDELPLPVQLDPARPEVGLFEADGQTALDLFWVPKLEPGAAYGRVPSGAESFGWIE